MKKSQAARRPDGSSRCLPQGSGQGIVVVFQFSTLEVVGRGFRQRSLMARAAAIKIETDAKQETRSR